MKQEYSAITTLLRDTKDATSRTRAAVYYGIAVHKLFAMIKMRVLKAPPGILIYGDGPEAPKRHVSRAFWWLSLSPALVLIAVFICDLVTLFCMEAIFRVPHKPLWQLLSQSSRYWASVYLTASLAAAVTSWQVLVSVINYEAATSESLRRYGQELHAAGIIPCVLDTAETTSQVS